jgi:hypothetical protein
MSPRFARLPLRVCGPRSGSTRRAAVWLAALALVVVTGCSSKKSGGSAAPPPVEQLPPPIRTGHGTPTGPALTGTIGAAGGNLVAADGRLRLSVPAGALAADTVLSVEPVRPTALGGVGGAFRLGPDGVALRKPVTLVLQVPVTPTGEPVADILGLGISYQDATGFWYPVKEVVRDRKSVV